MNDTSLFQFIEYMLGEYPVRDGVSHPLENTLKQTVASSVGESFKNWLMQLLENGKMDLFADLLQLLGRLDPTEIGDWYLEVTKVALESPSITVRDAAVSAIESWFVLFGDRKSLALLQSHHEETAWLREYIERLCLRKGEGRWVK